MRVRNFVQGIKYLICWALFAINAKEPRKASNKILVCKIQSANIKTLIVGQVGPCCIGINDRGVAIVSCSQAAAAGSPRVSDRNLNRQVCSSQI